MRNLKYFLLVIFTSLSFYIINNFTFDTLTNNESPQSQDATSIVIEDASSIITEDAVSIITKDVKILNNQVEEKTIIKEEKKHLSVRPEVTYPGDIILVQASQAGMIEFNEKEYRLQRAGKSNFIAFLPISIDQTPEELEISWILDDEDKSSINKKVAIKEKEFSSQYLEVTKQQEEMTQNSNRIEEDRQKVRKALANPIQEPLFSGVFFQPLDGRISTIFGYTRYVNGVLSSRHLAIDIAASEGTPIIAPNNGKIVLADNLYLSGNRVIIDHGINLISSYSHMSKLNVQVGDEVHKGDVIGWVGSTGFSTGPHLHHAIYVQGYAVNPELFFNTDPYDWE